MTAIYKKEMRAYFAQMHGYAFLAAFAAVVGIWFTSTNVLGLNPNFHMTLDSTTIFFFILIPILTMRLFSEEARAKTDQLLFTSPLSITGIVMGKFLAAASLFFTAAAVTLVLPFMLSFYGALPVSRIAGGYIGFVLLGLACIAVGLFISVLTDNQIVAAIGSMGAIFVMFLMDFLAAAMPTGPVHSLVFVGILVAVLTLAWYNSVKSIWLPLGFAAVGLATAGGLYLIDNLIFDGLAVRVLLWFSVFARAQNFTMGLVHLADVVYYLSFAALFVFLTINTIEKRRWR
jgi:ABC-2 type transport system permease protein